ncbi:hypothetical protein IQ07DRAFT_34933 [Pyrenochaeta sp. DS3sAY3a]|nr:hypothetical protein IQ07DRAFT_34933 [Pyrenochaeta sp. DS3sAY3a]
MANYEELVELGFEGVDKFAQKYHDKVYDHLPALPPLGKKDSRGRQSSQSQQTNQQRQQQRQPPDEGYSRPRSGPPPDDNYIDNRRMYAPDRQDERDYRSERDYRGERYYEDERVEYKGPGAGALVARGRDDFSDTRGYQVAPYQASQRGYDQSVDYYDRGRPAPQRRRSSWSPPRSEKHHGREEKNRARSRSKDKQHRIMATVTGAIVGGLVGNQIRKGQKYDTVATIAGAVVGGVGAREASEYWDSRRQKREERQEAWEDEYGEDDRDDRRRDDKYDNRRYDRDERRRY